MTDEITFPIEVRADESLSGPGRLYGVLMHEGTKASDRAETFAPGSLSWPDGGVPLNVQHDRRSLVQRVTPERRGNQVIVDEPIIETQRGRDLATMIRSGAVQGLSVEFRSKRQRYDGGRRVVLSAELTAAGAVDSPSYKASVVEVRNRGELRRGTGGRLWL